MIKLKNYIKDINNFLIVEEFLKNSLEEQQDLLQGLYQLKEKFSNFLNKINKIAAKQGEDPKEIFKEIISRANEIKK